MNFAPAQMNQSSEPLGNRVVRSSFLELLSPSRSPRRGDFLPTTLNLGLTEVAPCHVETPPGTCSSENDPVPGFSPTHRPFPAGQPTSRGTTARCSVFLPHPGLPIWPRTLIPPEGETSLPRLASRDRATAARTDSNGGLVSRRTWVFGPLWRMRSNRVHIRGFPDPLCSVPAVSHDFDGFLRNWPSGIFQPVTPMGLPPSRAFFRAHCPKTATPATVFPLRTRFASFRMRLASSPLFP